MAEEKNERMHIRARGRARERTLHKKEEPSPDPDPKPAYAGRERRTPENLPLRELFDAYKTKMGVAELTLLELERSVGSDHMEELKTQIATAQLSRVGVFGKSQTLAYQEELRPRDLSGLAGHLLEFALKVKPVDTLYQVMDMNLNVPAVFEACRRIRAGNKGVGAEVSDNPEVTEVVRQYRALIALDASFLTTKNEEKRAEKLEEVYAIAVECFEALQSMMAGHKEKAGSSEEDGRITAETMRRRREQAGSQDSE